MGINAGVLDLVHLCLLIPFLVVPYHAEHSKTMLFIYCLVVNLVLSFKFQTSEAAWPSIGLSTVQPGQPPSSNLQKATTSTNMKTAGQPSMVPANNDSAVPQKVIDNL